MTLQVRSAVSADEGEVIGVIRAAMVTYERWCPGWPSPTDVEDRERARWHTRDPVATWLVACMTERVVGVIRWVGGEPATLSLLMVDPEFWNAGVGSALQADALHGMAHDGSQTVRLTVPEGNGRARRFYERHGWRKTDAPPRAHPWLGLHMLEYARSVCAHPASR
jgi:GNAT superfamily N-acetyltransferase